MNLNPLKKIETPTVWNKHELLQQQDWIFALGNDEQAFLLHSLNQDTLSLLPPTLLQKTMAITEQLENNTGVVLIKHFPISSDVNLTKTQFLKLMTLLGALLPQNTQGQIVYDVKKTDAVNQQMNRGPLNNEELAFHSDRCDVTALLCCQKAPLGGETRVVNSIRIHNEMIDRDPTLLAELYNPFYYAKAHWEKATESIYTLPIFSRYQSHFASRYMRPLIDLAQLDPHVPPLRDTQKMALTLLESIAQEDSLTIEFLLEPGDILLFNNFVTFHARNAFQDDPSQRRHLLRIWLAMPNSRPLSPDFLPLFGNIGAGQIRGGFL